MATIKQIIWVLLHPETAISQRDELKEAVTNLTTDNINLKSEAVRLKEEVERLNYVATQFQDDAEKKDNELSYFRENHKKMHDLNISKIREIKLLREVNKLFRTNVLKDVKSFLLDNIDFDINGVDKEEFIGRLESIIFPEEDASSKRDDEIAALKTRNAELERIVNSRLEESNFFNEE